MADLQTDLEALDRAARQDMPLLAKVYAAALNQVGATESAAQGVGRDPAVYRNAGDFGNAWVGVLNKLTNILYTCQDDATKIGTALSHVVDTYAATEAKIKADIQAITDSLSKQS